MKKKGIVIIGIIMLAISIFMTISYYQLIESGKADSLNRIVYYVWIISIPVWTIMISIKVFQILKKRIHGNI